MKTTRPRLPWYELGFIVASSAIVAAFVIHLAVRFLTAI